MRSVAVLFALSTLSGQRPALGRAQPSGMVQVNDSTDGRCALFNCACEPYQPGTDGREAFIHPARELTPVYGYGPNWRGFYNLPGNAVEMTSGPCVVNEGPYAHRAKATLPRGVHLMMLRSPGSASAASLA
jgi:hypothetical protein